MRAILVGGCGRSGTTLVGSLLGRGHGCVTVPESQFRLEMIRAMDQGGVPEAVRLLERNWRFRTWGISVPTSQEAASAQSAADLFELLVEKYAAGSDVKVWVDHTPANLRFAATWARMFGDVRFVHVVRDGRGVAASVIPLDWGPNTILVAASWWLREIAAGLAVETAFPPSNIQRVRYEDLVRSPDQTISDLRRTLDVPPPPSRADEHGGFRVPKYTRNQHTLVGGRVEESRAEAWREGLSDRQIELFEYATGDVLELLGYPLEFGPIARPPRRAERLWMFLRERFRQQIVNRVRLTRRRSHS